MKNLLIKRIKNIRHSHSAIANPEGARKELRAFHPDGRHTLEPRDGSQGHPRLRPLRGAYKTNNHPAGHPQHSVPIDSLRSDDSGWGNVLQTRGYQRKFLGTRFHDQKTAPNEHHDSHGNQGPGIHLGLAGGGIRVNVHLNLDDRGSHASQGHVPPLPLMRPSNGT